MIESGPHISAFRLDRLGFRDLAAAHWNWPMAALYERAVARGEGEIAKDGPLVVKTGIHTGRSASDKFTVRDAITGNAVWWDNNKAMTPDHFAALRDDFLAYAKGKELYVQDLHGGADETHRLKVRVVTELAWHALFIQHLLIEPQAAELASFTPEFTVVDFPGFKADPDRKSTRLNSSHIQKSRMPSSA